MKSFYSSEGPLSADGAVGASERPYARVTHSTADAPYMSRARIAVYDAPAAAPRVEEIACSGVGEYIESLTTRIYELAHGAGGDVPYTVVRELSENLIHADFTEPVVSILDAGKTIRFADQGPGIPDKDRAVLPGFTTARGDMKQHIRGVGSGLPIVSDFLAVSGGSLLIEDNLGSGAVVTITTTEPEAPAQAASGATSDGSIRHNDPTDPVALSFELDAPSPVAPARLTTRQKQVLALVLESGSAGPSIVSRELGVGLSTAYRDLASLEDLGLISSVGGKRALTEKGMALLGDVLSSS